jgi:glycosyltransferase involved in cell wall biosynthesis
MQSQTKDETLLTIAIPTFDRRDSVCARLRELVQFNGNEKIKVLISDNNSNDGTFSELEQIVLTNRQNFDVRLNRNNSNLGAAENYFKLFELCDTEYILLMSDEDELIDSSLNKLFRVIAEYRPNFVSPIALVNGNRYRGKNKTQNIKFSEHSSSSFYISGLCFKTNEVKEILPWIRNLARSNHFVDIYPLVAIAASLVLEGRSYWLDAELTLQRDDLPSEETKRGRPYWTLDSRYIQFIDNLNFLSELAIRANEQDKVKMINDYKENLRQGIFDRVRESVSEEDKQLLKFFDATARRYYLFSWFYRILRGPAFSILRDKLPDHWKSAIRRIFKF